MKSLNVFFFLYVKKTVDPEVQKLRGELNIATVQNERNQLTIVT